MNRYYRYPNIAMWAAETWEDRRSPISGLVRYLQTAGKEDRAPVDNSGWASRTDGRINPVAGCVEYDGVLDAWAARGLHWHCKNVGGLPWISMVPVDMVGRFGNDPLVMVSFIDAARGDPYWAMNALKAHEAMLACAAEERAVVFFIATDGWEETDAYIYILLEGAPLWHLGYSRMFLDVSEVTKHDRTLNDVPGWTPRDEYGNAFAPRLETVLDTPALDITRLWPSHKSIVYNSYTSEKFTGVLNDRAAIVHSDTGRKVAEGIALERRFVTYQDPAFTALWREKGLNYAWHRTQGMLWHTWAPEGALRRGEKLPCLCLFHETGLASPHEALNAVSYNYGLFEIAAQGEFLLLLFAMERKDDNELLGEILEEAAGMYPIDETRVYVTGHSHNGQFALEYALRHSDRVAAAAISGNLPGLPDPALNIGGEVIYDEATLTRIREANLPMVWLSGYAEHSGMFPLNQDAFAHRPGARARQLTRFEDRARSWQRRLDAHGCPPKTIEEIAATRESGDPVERKLGIPFDWTQALFLDGINVYEGDVFNESGKAWLRIVCVDNMTHATPPVMHRMSWSFLRRFARVPGTRQVIERY